MTDIVERIRKEIERTHTMPPEMCGLDIQGMHEAADLIEALRSRAEKAEAENAELKKALDSIEIEHGLTSNGNLWRFWSAKARGVAAKYVMLEATCEKLAAALQQIIDMNVQYAIDRWGDANQAEPMACVRTAREALAYRKEASE